MKKVLIALGILFSTNCSAATISIQPWISSLDVTIPHLETQRTTIQNVINGNIEGGGQNIKAGSITSQDLANSINPVVFRSEAFNNWTYTGMLPTTSASLSTTISAGTSYVSGVRVVTSATAHTYTASKDTYTYINSGGFFDYVEVANGAAAPSTPANDLLLAKVVSSGTAITSVTDSRALSIQITANSSNFAIDYRNQAQIVRDSTTAVHVEPGQIAIGSTAYTLLTDSSSKSTATASNWIEGTVPNQNNLKYYVYAYNNSGTTFDIKFASADPVYSDTSLNTGGTLQYYVTGGTTYRALAWISADTAGTIQTYNYSNFPSTTTTNQVTFSNGAVTTGTTAIPNDDTIPQNTEGDQCMAITMRPTNINNKLKIEVLVCGSSSAENYIQAALFQDSTANALATSFTGGAATNMMSTMLTYYMTAGTTSATTFKVRIGAASGTTTFNGNGGARKFGGVSGSYITVKEIQ